MKNLLVTTGLKDTLGNNEKIIFLGQWCITLNNEKYLKNRDFIISDYHWRDKKKFYKDYKYLEKINEILIDKLGKKLNEIHKINFDQRQWRLVLGTFICHFIGLIWDRYESLRLTLDKYNIDKIINPISDEKFLISEDLDDFLKLIRTHNLNALIIKDIINIEFKSRINECHNCEIKTKFLNSSIKKNINAKIILAQIYDKFFRFFTKKNKIVFFETYLDLFSLTKLNFKLIQIPRFHYEFNKKFSSNKNLSIRKNIQLNINPQNSYEKILEKLVFKYLPSSYLENFQAIKDYVNNLKIKPKIIQSAIGQHHNDVFNIWSALSIENGAKLFFSQHGGSFRMKVTGDFDR